MITTGVNESVCQDWEVDSAPNDLLLNDPTNGGVVSTPLSTKPLSLNGLKPKGSMCEERTLRRSQTGQAQLGLSCKANKCSDAGTGDPGALTTQEASSMEIQFVMSAQPVPRECR